MNAFLASFSISKASLKPVPFTVVTHADGSRFVERRDGTTEPAADESGRPSWALLGEESVNEDETKNNGNGGEKSHKPSEALLKLVVDRPELRPYLKLVELGAPTAAVEHRLSSAVGQGVLQQAAAAAFLELVGAEGGQGGKANKAAAPTLEGAEFKSTSEMHGHLGDPSWPAPRLSAACDAVARPGYASKRGHEYLDQPDVLKAKVKLLAAMLTVAKKPVVYAGAGLSTASGISDYATKTGLKGTLAQSNTTAAGAPSAQQSPYCALPNLGHRALAALGRAGKIHRFVQQNHDGLPQKAGMPQHLLNEIHGAWFDPSNPGIRAFLVFLSFAFL